MPAQIRLHGGKGIRVLLQWAVIVGHYGMGAPLKREFGGMAVALFVVLSGFSTYVSYFNKLGKSVTSLDSRWEVVMLVRNMEWLIVRCVPIVAVVTALMPVFWTVKVPEYFMPEIRTRTPFISGWFEIFEGNPTSVRVYPHNPLLWFIGCILFHWLLTPIWYLWFAGMTRAFGFLFRKLWPSKSHDYIAPFFILLGVIVWDVGNWQYLSRFVSQKPQIYFSSILRSSQYGLGFALAHFLNTTTAHEGVVEIPSDVPKSGSAISTTIRIWIPYSVNRVDVGMILFVWYFFERYIHIAGPLLFCHSYSMTVPFLALRFLLTFSEASQSCSVRLLTSRIVNSVSPSASAALMTYIFLCNCGQEIEFNLSVAVPIAAWLAGHFGSVYLFDPVNSFVKPFADVSILLGWTVPLVDRRVLVRGETPTMKLVELTDINALLLAQQRERYLPSDVNRMTENPFSHSDF